MGETLEENEQLLFLETVFREAISLEGTLKCSGFLSEGVYTTTVSPRRLFHYCVCRGLMFLVEDLDNLKDGLSEVFREIRYRST